jgi:membrane fusion protein (multidrug efflux system)
LRRLAFRLAPLGVIATALAALAGIYIFVPVRDKSKDADPPPPVRVVLEEVRPILLRDTIDLDADVEPNEIVHVPAEVPGRVIRYARRRTAGGSPVEGSSLDEGDRVDKGDPILYIDPRDYESALMQAQAAHDYNLADMKRVRERFDEGLAAQSELDAARSALQTTRAALDKARNDLERTIVRSPIDGVIERMLVEVGEYASPGAPVAQIVDDRTVKVVVEVPEKLVHYLRVDGREHEVVASAAGPVGRKASISRIAALANPQTRATPVELTLDNSQGVFRAGQIVTVRMTLRELPDEIMVPLGAVVPRESGYSAYVARPLATASTRGPGDPNVVAGGNGAPDGHAGTNGGRFPDGANALAGDANVPGARRVWVAERRDVVLDPDVLRGRKVRVLSGLFPGDRLIVQGWNRVGPGDRVVDAGDPARGAEARPDVRAAAGQTPEP